MTISVVGLRFTRAHYIQRPLESKWQLRGSDADLPAWDENFELNSEQ